MTKLDTQSIDKLLEPFSGYLDLGMLLDATDELEKLPPEIKNCPRVLEAWLALLLEMSEWEEGVLLGEALIQLCPSMHEFYFKTAYCLHELKSTKEAKATLESAPMTIRDTALFYYNLACYETQLGHLDEAKLLLKECVVREPRYHKESLDDPDLEPLWESLAGTASIDGPAAQNGGWALAKT